MKELVLTVHSEVQIGSIALSTAQAFLYYKLAAYHYRCDRHWKKAYDVCMQALNSLPSDFKYNYMIYEELVIVSYYIGELNCGYDAAESILFSEHCPFAIKNHTLCNVQYYISALQFSRVIQTDFTTDDSNFVPSSASILNMDGKYRLNVRSVNYRIVDGNYNPQGSGIIITRNHIVDLDSDFKSVGCIELIDKSGYPMTYRPWSRGFEDIRLIRDGEFFCTTPDINSENIPQLMYGKYDDNGAITTVLPLQLGDKLKCEKNWLPFIRDGELYAVYSMDPLTIVRIDRDCTLEKRVQIVQVNDQIRLPLFRGSGGLLEYRGGYLCSVHQVYYNRNRLYFHRFVWFNSDFTACKYSRLFYFDSRNIEYSLSMCHSEHGLIVPYSIRDSCSKLGILPYEVLDRMLSL